jgi:hypothetical protein
MATGSSYNRHDGEPLHPTGRVLARDPGASGADLARACSTTPQAMGGVLTTLEREGLTVKAWLVDTAARLESRARAGPPRDS